MKFLEAYPWQKKLNYVPAFFYKNNDNFILNFSRFLSKKNFYRKNIFMRKIYKFLQLFLDPAVYHIEVMEITPSFFMKDAYSDLQKKIRSTYAEYLKISDETFNFSDKNMVDFRNIFITLATKNYFFDLSTMVSSIAARSPLLINVLLNLCFQFKKKKKNKKGLRHLYKKMLSKIYLTSL